jgi:aspartate aminotransferase/aminotransferase
MKPFASIPAEIPRSGIREIMDLAWAVEKTGEVIHLEVGQPDFETPAHIVEATCHHATAGQTKYVPNAGVDPLREAAARYFERSTGVATTSENILVTPGAVMSVATSFLSLLEPGDEVLLPDPGWPNYHMAVSIVHGKSVFYNLRADNNFLPDLEEIESLVTDKTKLILLCTPSNPTGQVYDEALMRNLMQLAQRHDLWVLSDEIYGEIVFDEKHHSALPHDRDGRALIVSGMSKSYAMTGYRVGFTRANPDYIELAAKLQEPFVSCGTGFSQLASAEALDGPQDSVATMRNAYHRRRDIALEVLRQYELYRYTPGGAIYLMIDISASGMDSHDFAVKLLNEKRVAVAPGKTFGAMCEQHVRISIAASDEHIHRGVTAICELVREGI